MNRQPGKGSKKAPVGPNIVRAWFDTVINPLLQAFEREQELLATRDWTWRFVPARLEELRHAAAYIDHLTRGNAEQFFAFYPEAKRAIDEHNKAVDALTLACQHLQEALTKSAELQKVYQQTTSSDSLAELGVKLSDLFGSYPVANHLALLAQSIINNAGEVLPYYSTAPLWNRYRKEFMAVLEPPPIRAAYENVLKKGKELRGKTDRCSALLKEIRLDLSLEHDQPYFVPGEINAVSPFQRF